MPIDPNLVIVTITGLQRLADMYMQYKRADGEVITRAEAIAHVLEIIQEGKIADEAYESALARFMERNS